MTAFLIIIAVIFYFVIDYVVADHFRQVAYAKGYDDNAHSFAMCFWLGIIGYIYVAALPDLVKRADLEKISGILETGKVSTEDGKGSEEGSEELPEL